jgi:hypothetical protein
MAETAFALSCCAAQMHNEHGAVPGMEEQANISHLQQVQQVGQGNTARYLLVLKEAARVSICSSEVPAQAEAQEDCSSARVPMAG